MKPQNQLGGMIQITECPRDAMQGIQTFIPTEKKVEYLNQLLKVGFDTLDFGSFVSPKAIPQLSDTETVLNSLELADSNTKLLAIVANKRGCEKLASFSSIHYAGYPFSVSETFQQRNTNRSIADSFDLVKEMMEICEKNGKELLVYLSMAFGNPYKDPWNSEIVTSWALKIAELGIKNIALADTVGIALPKDVFDVTSSVNSELKGVAIGAHLHCKPDNWSQKVAAAYDAGCHRFDTAMKGFGGCPMAEDELVGNLATERLVQYLDSKSVDLRLNRVEFDKALVKSSSIFS
jgi:hydroxymethylglutaryl-CoA lyase